ncbi:MAG TPA: hypothetical protein VMR23_11595 [Candidatus Limnocylindria bacterium]|nr:hypothetical protein [Candidatus Limnocylindria bacterium]
MAFATAVTAAGSVDLVRVRRAALWGMLAAKIVGGWGLGWDIRWHLLIGRDSFWIAPHVMTYASVAVTALLALGVLALETSAARGGTRPPAGSVKVAGLVGSRGFHLAWWGIALTIIAAPIDDLWHRLFGIDVTLWSPPHLLGLAGAQINTLACVAIIMEAWPRGHRARTPALALATTLLLGAFEVIVDPSVQTAFLRGSVFFFTYAVLGGLAFCFTLVLAARTTQHRLMPLVAAAGAVLFQFSVLAVADAGFALLQPVPAIEEAIAADPGAPIAIAHEMARRNGAPPGRSLWLRIFPVLPALLLVVIDARRRWLPASAAFGLALAAVSGVLLARSPSLSHALPSPPEIVAGLLLATAAAIAGGALATRTADGLEPIR